MQILTTYQRLAISFLLKKTINTLLVTFYDNYKNRPLNIMLPKTKEYVNHCYGQTKWMYFLIKDEGLLEKNNTIWDKISSNIKKGFDSELAYNNKCLKRVRYLSLLVFFR